MQATTMVIEYSLRKNLLINVTSIQSQAEGEGDTVDEI